MAIAVDASAQTNAVTRSRDDKAAFVNLAVQAIQQVQSQEQANLRAVTETRQEVSALRRLVLLVGVVLGAGLLTLGLYARSLLRPGRSRLQAPHASAEKLLRRAAELEHDHRHADALTVSAERNRSGDSD